MLSMSFKGVRGLPRSPGGSSLSEEKPMWSIQVQHGTQRHRTRSIELARSEKRDFVGTSDGGAQWDEEVEIYDKEDQETVEISLVFEGEPAVRVPRFGWSSCRRRRRHSIATVEMRSFRSQPEESVTVWLPLRSVSSDCDNDSGAIQVKLTYVDDCMTQGYLLTLFCGLLPLPLPDLWTGDIHVERDSVAIEEINIRDPWPSKAPSPLTKMEPFVAPGKEKESSTGPKLPQLVSQVAESSQKSQRRVRFEPVSELAFRGCVEAGAA